MSVEPTEQDSNCTWVVSQTVARSADESQLCRTVCLGQLASIGSRNAFVVVAVHYQQRTRRDAMCRVDGAKAAKLARPLIEAGRKPGSAYGTDLACVFEKSPWLCSPIIEVGTWAEQRGAGYARIVGRHARRNRATRVRADQPDTGRLCLMNKVIDGRAQIVDPTLK